MTRLVALSLTLLLFASCAELSESNSGLDVAKLSPTEIETGYRLATQSIQTTKGQFEEDASKQSLDSLAGLLHLHLIDSIFPYWYGTPWDFNGISQEPQKGKIACGYFVSTTLKQCGFELQRIKLAQQASSNIIKTLCDPDTKKIFTNGNFEGLKKHLQGQKEGLYIIGLDNHVAFISIEEDGIFVIHASPNKVKRQRLEDSSVVVKSKYHVIANFSHNHEVLKKWIKKESIPTKV